MSRENFHQWCFAEILAGEDKDIDSYIIRFQNHAPNFPKDVISMWLWRHGPTARTELLHIPPSAYRFRQVEITPNDLPNRTAYKSIDFFDTWSDKTKLTALGRPSKQADLWDYMAEKHTWPVPPLIIDVAASCPKLTLNLRKPFHIIDGHHRIAMAQVLRSQNLLQKSLPLWFCNIERS